MLSAPEGEPPSLESREFRVESLTASEQSQRVRAGITPTPLAQRCDHPRVKPSVGRRPHIRHRLDCCTRIVDAEVAKLLFTIRSRVLRLCHRRGLMGEEGELGATTRTETQGLLPLL